MWADRARSRERRVSAALRWAGLAAAVLLVGAAIALPSGGDSDGVSQAAAHGRFGKGGILTDPIDPKYLTQVPFGSSSFWIQPWRSYLDTWPASRLLNSLGINFNVSPKEAPAVARLLGDSGFSLARVEIGWNSLSYDDPTSFVDESSIRRRLLPLRRQGLRPLILLNANSGGPGPATKVELETVAPAAAGSRTVKLSAASAAAVVPGKTGFDQLAFGGNPDVLITSVGSNRVAQLSVPLPTDLPAGPHGGTTLLYGPFAPPTLASGSPNPEFQATLDGWLSYVQTVSDEAKSIFGPAGYDLEIWNEVSFGSEFLREDNYYSPPRDSGAGSSKEAKEALLAETVAYVRDPTHGISPKVGISDGFASQTPFASGAKEPAGVTALSKHLYKDPFWIPAEYKPAPGIKPIDAVGAVDSAGEVSKTSPVYQPLFVPAFRADFPEYFLTATQTETLIRDLAPMTTTINGVPHGRFVGLAGGGPSQIWMTEYNVGAESEADSGPATARRHLERAHLQAKGLLRSLVSMVAKGVRREYFYAATGAAGLSLVGGKFIAALNADPGSYPGSRLGGETIRGFRNLLGPFRARGRTGRPRQLTLLSIAQKGDRFQFAGDGTPAHPTLYDREALAVFPFQAAPGRFVVASYVMTRNLEKVYRPRLRATDERRYDLPPEAFRIRLGNVPDSRRPPSVVAYDPLLDRPTRARLVSKRGHEIVLEAPLTDYPRLLTVDFRRR